MGYWVVDVVDVAPFPAADGAVTVGVVPLLGLLAWLGAAWAFWPGCV